ncbi:tight adherence protein B [Sanguibacter gelidistatuariae]|uniref:Tight adherence protein B n=1 Tax=Sanguibacter gelidistatuariae TaxID=1814289 RepID=A0A1G6HK83_9MICO|nr:hypothetical protein [Sanguibacter gelidistatuariae]SDB94662.1 tight adherence protein B [Sanguibacter gelidistatuariae]
MTAGSVPAGDLLTVAADAITGIGAWAGVVGMLVGCAVLVVVGPRGRPVGRVARPDGRAGRWPGTLRGRLRRAPARGRPRSGAGGDRASVQVIVTQVAGLLRGGVSPGKAWPMVGAVRVDRLGVPDAGDLTALVSAGQGPGRTRDADRAQRQVAAIVAACRLAAEVGAPLAVVLDAIVGTLVGAARAESERAAALAGPRSTARVLAWLPGIGAVLGMALGADPLGLFLAGGLGAVAPAGGLVLVGVGHRWTARLVARARAAGEPL